jgi:hypothetical protein
MGEIQGMYHSILSSQMEQRCLLLKDGRVIEIAGDYTETLARLKTSPSAVGVFGLSFYEIFYILR